MPAKKAAAKKSTKKGGNKKTTKKAASKARSTAKSSSRSKKAKPAAKKAPARKKAASKKKTAKPTAKKVAKKKTAKKATAKKQGIKRSSAKGTKKKASGKKSATTKRISAKKTVSKKPSAKKAPAKKSSGKKTVSKKATARKTAAEPRKTAAPLPRNVNVLTGPVRGFTPYQPKRGEPYMNDAQLKHFESLLRAWKRELMEEVDRTMDHMKDDAANFPDPSDRATQESEFGLELRTRDRERKLLRKIDSALMRIEDGSYGYCEETGDEIGLRRLEARPVATLCVEAQERRELAERQYRDREDYYR